MSVSVCLSVTFVHCSHRVQWIPDIFACLDSLCSYIQRLTRIIGWDDSWISGGRGDRGIEKLVIVAISLNLLTESLLDGWTRNSNDGFCLHVDIYRIF